MRKSINVVGRGVSVAAVVLFLTIPASAATEQKEHPKFKPPVIEKTIKKIIKAFGDWMSVPIP